MTRAALTVWENRISPVYDSANLMLIIEIEEKQVVTREHESFNAERTTLLVERLSERGVSCFICGAISESPARLIHSSGIQLIPFISGNTDLILDTFAKGDPIVPRFLMPGCGPKRRKQRGKRGYPGCGRHTNAQYQ